jgi:transposase
MEQQCVRKSYKYKLPPTPEQERALEVVLWRCRTLYNTALEQRILLYRQRGASLTRYSQEAELTDLRADVPEYAAIHSHILQEQQVFTLYPALREWALTAPDLVALRPGSAQ